MPNRLLREGINDSEAINRLSFRAELFYRRLMSKVDDFGRCEEKLTILRTRLFAYQLDRWTEEDIDGALAECEASVMDDGTPLITRYAIDGKRYLQINKFGQRLRTPNSKIPCPRGQMCADGGQMSASSRRPPTFAAHARAEAEAEAEVEAETEAEAEANEAPPPHVRPQAEHSERKRAIRQWLTEYLGAFGIDWGVPDPRIIQRIHDACRGAPLEDIQRRLVSLAKRKRVPGKSWAWFERVLSDEFAGEREHPEIVRTRGPTGENRRVQGVR